MSININIKGLTEKENLKNKNLKTNFTNIINGNLKIAQNLCDIFEIDISYDLIENNIIPFNDNTLIVLKGFLNFNIIGSTKENLGVFLKEKYPFLIKYSTNSPNKDFNIIFVDGFFHLLRSNEISFSLVSIITNNIAKRKEKFYCENLECNDDFNFDEEFI